MLTPVTKITVTQQPTADFPNRDKVVLFNFCTEFHVETGWETLTDTATVIVPAKVRVRDYYNKTIYMYGEDVATGRIKEPVFLRGDKIKIEAGYLYDNAATGRQDLNIQTIFEGWITNIKNQSPLEFTCEDNMYKLKLLKAPNKVFHNVSVQDMVAELIAGTDFTLSTGTTLNNMTATYVGDFRIQNATVAQCLEALRKDNNLYSYFRGNELRVGSIVYYPSDMVTHNFGLQKNVIAEGTNLEYRREEDVRIGVKAVGIKTKVIAGTNKNGTTKYKTERIQAQAGDVDGEIRTLHFYGVTDPVELKKLAENMIPRLKYTGFRGSFNTFGLPLVKHGDSCVLSDSVRPEISGSYLAKKVVYHGGMGGHKQDVTIDLRTDGVFTNDQILAGL